MKIECAHTEVVDIETLVPNPKNPNKHGDKQIKMLAKIMKHQGWRHPITVSNRSGFIVAGHGRLAAARLNGWEKAPVDRQDFANEADEYAHMIADNKIAELAEHDDAMMMRDVLEFPDLDYELLGIPDFEPIAPEIIPQADEDDVPEEVADPNTVLGDIWKLGRHRLMCGDATNVQHVDALIDGAKIDMVFTDPPFPNNSEIMHDMIENIDGAFANARSICKHQMLWFWDNLAVPPFVETITAKHIWHKTNGWQAGHFESIYCYHNDGKRHEQLVFSENSVGGENKRSNQGNHPTPKPISLICNMFEKLKLGERCIDLFGGSGSTLIACEKTNRTCYVLEIEPKYVRTIIDRWEKYTGQKAELISS